MINSINNIELTDSFNLDDDVMRSLIAYRQLLDAVEPYNITDLSRLKTYMVGLAAYDNYANKDSNDYNNAPSRIYQSDITVQYRLINYIEAKRQKREEWAKHPYPTNGLPLAPMPMPPDLIKEVNLSNLKAFVDFNADRYADINNIANFEESFTHQDMVLQYQLHSDILLITQIYEYINMKRGWRIC